MKDFKQRRDGSIEMSQERYDWLKEAGGDGRAWLTVTERINERVERVVSIDGYHYRVQLLHGKAYLAPRGKHPKGDDNPYQRDAFNADKAALGSLPEDQIPLL